MQLESPQFVEPESEVLDSPHFDDENTLLSAQPVVPLADVSKPRKRRNLRFSAGIGFLAIGLCAAALIQFCGTNSKSQQASISAERADSPSAKPGTVTAPPADDSSPNLSSSKRESSTPTLATETPDEKPMVVRSARPKAYRAFVLEHDFKENEGDWDNLDKHTRREIRREARQAERRARRAAERGQDEDNGVFRITDLFEGSRRP